MGSAKCYIVLAVLVGVSSAMVLEGIENIDDKFEPLVAFKCGYASQYLTRAGWQVDHSSSCLSNPEDIKAYCTSKYPKRNITNVIPSPSEIEGNWTVLNGSMKETLKVRPYRCIVGEFNSDALVVPDGCKYSIMFSENVTDCFTYFEWNVTAHDQCAAYQSELFSFGVVKPCQEVGLFYFMEYVCCPSASKSVESNATSFVEPSQKSKTTRPQMQRSTPQPDDYEIDYSYEDVDQMNDWYDVSAGSEITDDEYNDDGDYQYDFYDTEEDEQDEQYDQELEDELQYEDDEYFNQDDEFVPAPESVDSIDGDDYDPTKNYFQIYKDTPTLLGNTENEIYVKALRYVKRYYDSQKQRLLQQLAEAEARVLDAKNATAARQTLAEDIATIRKLYEKTDKTWYEVRQSMLEEHEIRIAKDPQIEREMQSEAWKNAVKQLKPNSTLDNLMQLIDVLKRYIRSEEKERVTWINRYEALLETDSAEAQRMQEEVKAALRAIHQRLQSVVESLKRQGVAKIVVDSVQALVKDYLKNYTDEDNEVRLLFPDLNFESPIDSTTADELLSTPATRIEFSDDDFNNADEGKMQFGDEVMRVTEQKPVMLIVVASVGAFVFVLILVSVVVLVCSFRKRRNRHTDNTRARRHTAALHHALFLVPDATKHGSLEPMHLDSGARRILVDMPPSPRPSVYAQTTHSSDRRIRGHDNPLNNYAGIVFSDSAPLVENDILNEDSKRVA